MRLLVSFGLPSPASACVWDFHR